MALTYPSKLVSELDPILTAPDTSLFVVTIPSAAPTGYTSKKMLWSDVYAQILQGITAGADDQILFNNLGAIDADAGLTFDVDNQVFGVASALEITGTGINSFIRPKSNSGIIALQSQSGSVFSDQMTVDSTGVTITNQINLPGYATAITGVADTGSSALLATKGYVDSIVAGGIVLQGDWNANTPDISTETTTGYAWRVSVAGSTDLGGITDWLAGDLAVKTDSGWLKIDNNDIDAVWGNITGTLSNQTDLQNALDAKEDTLTFDAAPTISSTNPVESGGVYTALLGKEDSLTFGITVGNAVQMAVTAEVSDYARFTATGLTGRTFAEVKTDLSLNNVENTALSTWAGSANINTLGTITTGVWNGTDIAIADGGTGQSTAQAAINALTAVSGATEGQVLTKTGSNAVWEDASGGGGDVAVEDDGTQILAAASILNFAGAGVVVTDGGGGEAVITISGGGGGAFTSSGGIIDKNTESDILRLISADTTSLTLQDTVAGGTPGITWADSGGAPVFDLRVDPADPDIQLIFHGVGETLMFASDGSSITLGVGVDINDKQITNSGIPSAGYTPIDINQGSDLIFGYGNVKMGYLAPNADDMYIANASHFTDTGYAVKQDSSGVTRINSNTDLIFCTGGSDAARIIGANSRFESEFGVVTDALYSKTGSFFFYSGEKPSLSLYPGSIGTHTTYTTISNAETGHAPSIYPESTDGTEVDIDFKVLAKGSGSVVFGSNIKAPTDGTLTFPIDVGSPGILWDAGPTQYRLNYINGPYLRLEELQGPAVIFDADNTNFDLYGTLKVDTINEHTAAAGVTIDGLLIKDGVVPEGSISNQGSSPDGYVLTLSGGVSVWAAPTGITSVSEDTTPQLGGDLDVNGKRLTNDAPGNITFAVDLDLYDSVGYSYNKLRWSPSGAYITSDGSTITLNNGTNDLVKFAGTAQFKTDLDLYDSVGYSYNKLRWSPAGAYITSDGSTITLNNATNDIVRFGVTAEFRTDIEMYDSVGYQYNTIKWGSAGQIGEDGFGNLIISNGNPSTMLEFNSLYIKLHTALEMDTNYIFWASGAQISESGGEILMYDGSSDLIGFGGGGVNVKSQVNMYDSVGLAYHAIDWSVGGSINSDGTDLILYNGSPTAMLKIGATYVTLAADMEAYDGTSHHKVRFGSAGYLYGNSGEVEIYDGGDTLKFSAGASGIGFFGTTPATQQSALTTALTTLTFTGPTTPDYALQDVTQTSPWGFADGEEARTFISVVKNLQDRVNELETKLQAYGLLA